MSRKIEEKIEFSEKSRPGLMAFAKRLRSVILEKKVDVKDLAMVGEIASPTATGYLKAESQPSQDVVGRWVIGYGINANWLLTGQGEMFLGDKDTTEIRRLAAHARPDHACVVYDEAEPEQITGHVLGVSSLIGAGPPSELVEPDTLFKVCIPPEYWRASILAYKVAGDSMEPIIKKGALVGIDRDQRQIIAGEVYAVHVPYEGYTLKMVFVDPAGKRLLLRSKNPEHPEQHLPIDDGREDYILGRAVWVMQGL